MRRVQLIRLVQGKTSQKMSDLPKQNKLNEVNYPHSSSYNALNVQFHHLKRQ